MSETPATVRYTNWRGETTERRLLLGDVRFGTTEWHPKPTWLIKAFDLDHPAQIWKEFDLLQCDFTCTPTDERMKALEAENARLRDALSLYSCEDGCNDCPEHERDLVSCGWTARAALRDIGENKG